MRVAVVGLGVMGLPAAAELAARGHEVVALDRAEIGNRLASSSGASRIFRLAHPAPGWVRMAVWNHELWERLERDAGEPLRWRRGLIWTGDTARDIATALESESVEHEMLDQRRQADLFPELRWGPERLALWQPDAGAVMADRSLAAVLDLLERRGGRLEAGVTVTSIEPTSSGVHLDAARGEERVSFNVDRVVLAAGPWARPMLRDLGVEIALNPYLEQVTYVRGGDHVPWADRPCLVDPPSDASSFGFYALPTPGIGYKIGVDDPIAVFEPASLDRTPLPEREREAVEWIAREVPSFDASPIRSEVCAWTNSPDGAFVIDRVGDVIFGCGDSGQGFKFLPMFGQVLADLIEDRPLPEAVRDDLATLGADRFAQRPGTVGEAV